MSGGSWQAVARAQGGVISRAQLQANGLSPDQVDRLVPAGRLIRVANGIYRAAAAPATQDGRVWQAVLGTGGVLVASSAAHLWQLITEPPAVIQLAVDPGRRIAAPPGTTVRRVRLPPADVTRRLGLPVTTRTRSVIDHLASIPFTAAVAFADRAIAQGWLQPADLDRRLEAPQRGNAQLRRVARTLVVGAEAESERRLHRLLRRAAVTGWVANHAVFDGPRFVARVDVAFVSRRLAVEVDGFAYHSDRERFQHDRRRQNDLMNLGWAVLRFTWTDLVERPEYVLDSIRQQLQRMEDLPRLAR